MPSKKKGKPSSQSRKDAEEEALLDAAIEEAKQPKEVPSKKKKQPSKDGEGEEDMPKFCCDEGEEGEEHICPLCLDVYFQNPKQVMPCKHCFCGGCFSGLQKRKNLADKCPSCRGPIKSAAPASAEVVEALGQLMGQCEDCGWQGTMKEFQASHAKACAEKKTGQNGQPPAATDSAKYCRTLLRQIKNMRQAGTSPAEIWKLFVVNNFDPSSNVDKETAAYSEYLCMKAQVFVDAKQKPTKESIAWAEESVAIRNRLGIAGNKATVSTMQLIGWWHMDLENYDAAIATFEQILITARTVFRENDIEMASHVTNLALAFEKKGTPKATLGLFSRALGIRERHFGRESVQIAGSLDDLLRINVTLAEYETAIEHGERLLQLLGSAGAHESERFACAHNNLAVAHRRTGQAAKSVPLFEQALRVYEKLFGPTHTKVEDTVNNLVGTSITLEQYEKAIHYGKRWLGVLSEAGEHETRRCGVVSQNLGVAYLRSGQHAMSVRPFEQALRVFEKLFGPSHYMVADTLNNLLCIHGMLEQYEKAIQYGERLLQLREAGVQIQNIDFADSLHALASCYQKKGGSNTKSLGLFQRAFSLYDKHFELQDPEWCRKLEALRESFRALEDAEHASLCEDRLRRIEEHLVIGRLQ